MATCLSAPLLAGELRRAGLTARTGRITTVDHLVRRSERAALAADGTLLADMESAPLAGAAGDRPVAVIRAVSDTPVRPVAGIVSGGLAALRSLRAAAPVAERWAAACGPRQVLLAGPRSFCAGVERAIEIVERALELQGKPVYVRKQIVHNTRVVGELEDRGAVFVDELDQVPDGATVVFSAHGVSPAVRDRGVPARAGRDRRDLPAGVQGARGGPPVRRRRVHGRADRPRGPRRGRGHPGRGAGLDGPGADPGGRGQAAIRGTGNGSLT